jgi:thioesterase domain-containing protein/acyl carrier protein
MIRGQTVEIAEVEAALTGLDAIKEVAVVDRPDGGGQSRLVAYVVLSPDITWTADEIRRVARTLLPEFMVPSVLVVVASLPKTPSGKVDRRGLPPPPSVRHDVDDVPVPPSDTVELHLVKIWESVLETEPISVTDNFFALGGHSLLAVRLMDRIRKVFGAQLPLDTLWYHGGTVQGLATILRKDASTVEWPTLVELQPLGRKRPLFCVHTIGGNLYHYDHLARLLDPDRPVLGLQARGVYGQSPPHSRIEDIAADCVQTMRERQPEGPYLIAGFSSGGIVAYEVAQQLRAAGQTVGMLALFDTFSPRFQGTRKLKRLLPRLLGGRGLRYLQEFLYHRVLTAVGRPDLRRLRAVGEAQRWAHLSYRPRPCPGDVEFFRAAESAARMADPTLGWGELVQGRIAIHEVPGSHGLMVKPPAVDVLVAQLRACLDAISATADDS